MNPLERVRPGSLLVAAPSLVDPNFRRTVVYLIAHGEEGTVGVVLNRPSDTAVFNVLPAWSGHASRPPAVYVGGPVQTSAAMCLGGLPGRGRCGQARLHRPGHRAGRAG